jgi:hypothetical protein
MPRWFRWDEPELEATTYVEVGDDGWALRHVEVRGRESHPVTAETLVEVLHLRDHGTLAEMREYVRRYGKGTVAEANLSDIETDGQGHVVEVSEADFEQVWRPARRALDERP